MSLPLAFPRTEEAVDTTDSTPTRPPSIPAVDIAAICAAKIQAVAAMPKHCPHCDAPFVPESYVENPTTGEIVTWCKGKCRRHDTVFLPAGALTVPVFAKTCVWNPPRRVHTKFASDGLPLKDDGTPDFLALHGADEPDWKCQSCGQLKGAHRIPCDQNGWYIARTEPVDLPANWPRFDPATHSWK